MATTNEIRNWPLAALDDDAPRIALVSYDSLGDGLVYLMMAENLRLNGFDVTYYGNCIYHLAGWFPQLSIRPYPEPDRIESELKDFDLVLYSPPSFVRHRATEAEMRRLAERYVMICVSRNFAGWWRVDHTQRIEKELPPEKSRRLRRLASCSGTIRHRLSTGQTVVQATLSFMQKDMGLERVTPGRGTACAGGTGAPTASRPGRPVSGLRHSGAQGLDALPHPPPGCQAQVARAGSENRCQPGKHREVAGVVGQRVRVACIAQRRCIGGLPVRIGRRRRAAIPAAGTSHRSSAFRR